MTLSEERDGIRGIGELRNGSTFVGFKHHLKAATVPGEATYLLSRRGVTTLSGHGTEVLVPLLDGSLSLAEVTARAMPALTPDEVEEALGILADAGLLRFARSEPAASSTAAPARDADAAAAAYWELAGLDGARAAAELAESRLRIMTLPGVDASPAILASAESGIALTDADADLTLVLCDDYLAPELAEIDAEHRAAGRPWLLARLCGYEPWVGPFFRPNEGPCWWCLAARLRLHRDYEIPLQHALGLDRPPQPPPASLLAGRAVAVQTSILEAAKWLGGIRHPEQSELRTLDTLTLRTRGHAVPRRPQCSSCGDPMSVSRRIRAPFVPRSRLKGALSGGGHRALTAEQLLERYEHLVSPVTGVVAEIKRAPNAPEFTASYVSGRNLAMGRHTLSRLRAGVRSLSGGKGSTDIDARAGALCEAVERYSGTRHGDEYVVTDTFRALGDAAVHPNACQLYADQQFRDRARWNRSGSPFHRVPEPFDEERPVEWTPVWSLTASRPRLLPTSMLYFPSGAPGPRGPYADSNGNAAGGSPEDAVVQGFLELVERDAVALWWYNRTAQPALDLDAFAEPYIDRLRDGYRRMGREIWSLDLTSDLGIPVVAALSRRVEGPSEDIVFGFGAHFDPALALRRALTEMGQLLPAVSRTGPDGGYAVSDELPVRWWQHATTVNQPYLAPGPGRAARTPVDWHYVPRADLLDDIRAVTELVRDRGMELLVLDQTRPDVGLPVVKVIVPGLRHFWARFAPGRLFDVPVSLGRVVEKTRYEELNPIPLFV